MVTFTIPGDDASDARSAAATATPRSRPPLPFANRTLLTGSPFGGSGKVPSGTPRIASSANKGALGRDGQSSGSLNQSSIATARNIFRSSSISDSPPPTVFSPSLPASTMKRVFAPNNTPGASRTHRESTATATPRGMAAKSLDADLFSVRIPSPSAELSGEVLTRKVPQEWSSTSSIYADQYLAHLCPSEFDDEQRRQFFCILDLRRLKYAADEIFCKKGWKLNVLNFAKEFEKSRSIILLRYGLYKFQNVQPSKEVLKRWRREHGIADDETSEAQSTPSKIASTKKRKADETSSEDRSKRRTVDEQAPEPVQAKPVNSTPAPASKKRSLDDDDAGNAPSKMAKSTPSAAKSLFEKAANKTASSSTGATSAPPATSNLFTSSKPAADDGSKSVFSRLSSGPSKPAAVSNIFGHLSDNSAQNSGVDADAESETDSDDDNDEDDPQPNKKTEDAPTSGNASVVGSQTSSLFGKPAAPDSAPETRESTPARSLFERIAKGNDGAPLRGEDSTASATPVKPANQTWNPSTTPIKFAPSSTPAPDASSGNLFSGSSAAAPSSANLFAPKPASSTPASSVSNSAKTHEPPQDAANSQDSTTNEKSGDESDKENDSQALKPAFGATSSTSAANLFASKPAEASAAAEPTKPTTSLFGSAPKLDAPAPSVGTNLFASAKPSAQAATSSTAPTSSTTLFGNNKPSESSTSVTADAPKSVPSFSFGSTASGSQPNGSETPKAPSNIFGGLNANTTSKPLFGTTTPAPAVESAKPSENEPAKSASSIFNFGAAQTNGASKPLFAAPTSPPAGSANNFFSGSPMKQDEPSPAKRAFNSSNDGDSVPKFAFGGNQATSNLFGATNGSGPTSGNAGLSFGGPSQASGSANSSFNFNFGGGGGGGNNSNNAGSGGSFNNPFTSSSSNGFTQNSAGAQPNSGGMFSFGGAASAGGQTGNSSPFQFGGGGSNGSTTPTTNMFGGASQSTSQPSFGGGSGVFNFSGGSSQPVPPATTNVFGANPNPPSLGNLQQPGGGASTTGTNTPFTLGGGSSLATTPAAGTPEPTTNQAHESTTTTTTTTTGSTTTSNNNNETTAAATEGEEDKPDEQVKLTDGNEADEEVLHEVRAKVLKFVAAAQKDGSDKSRAKSPWTTQGVGSLRLLQHKESKAVRLLLRAEPRGNVAMNKIVLPKMKYEANEKYVKLATSNDEGDGLETWMVQVKTKDLAKALAESLEEHKVANKE